MTEHVPDPPTEGAKPTDRLPIPAAGGPRADHDATVEGGAIAAVDLTGTGGPRAEDVAGAFARNTRAAYRADWRRWEGCQRRSSKRCRVDCCADAASA